MRDILFMMGVLIGASLSVFTIFVVVGVFLSVREAAFFAVLTTGGIAVAALIVGELLEVTK